MLCLLPYSWYVEQQNSEVLSYTAQFKQHFGQRIFWDTHILKQFLLILPPAAPICNSISPGFSVSWHVNFFFIFIRIASPCVGNFPSIQMLWRDGNTGGLSSLLEMQHLNITRYALESFTPWFVQCFQLLPNYIFMNQTEESALLSSNHPCDGNWHSSDSIVWPHTLHELIFARKNFHSFKLLRWISYF